MITPKPNEKLEDMLDSQLQYKRLGAQFMPNPLWAIVRLYKRKTSSFPWGLLNKVILIFNQWEDYTKSEDTYELENPKLEIDIEKFNSLSVKLRDYQKKGILQLILSSGGILCLPTGAGKTFTAIEYIKYMGLKTLIVVHTLDLKHQWEKQIPDNVDVRTYQSIKDRSILCNYLLVITDEAHHVSSKLIYNIAMNSTNAIIVGLSATPYREDGEDMKIHAALGEIVYSITRKELIQQGYLADATVKYIHLTNHTKDRTLDYQQIYKKYIIDNEERNNKIIDIIKENISRNILVLVTQIEHGEYLSGLLKSDSIDHIFLHGKIKDRNIPKDKKIIIASTIWDEGVDLPSFDVLILAAGGKSSIKLTQRVGRVLRPMPGKKALIYDFIDLSNYLSRHYKKRRKILEEEFEVIENGG